MLMTLLNIKTNKNVTIPRKIPMHMPYVTGTPDILNDVYTMIGMQSFKKNCNCY